MGSLRYFIKTACSTVLQWGADNCAPHTLTLSLNPNTIPHQGITGCRLPRGKFLHNETFGGSATVLVVARRSLPAKNVAHGGLGTWDDSPCPKLAKMTKWSWVHFQPKCLATWSEDIINAAHWMVFGFHSPPLDRDLHIWRL